MKKLLLFCLAVMLTAGTAIADVKTEKDYAWYRIHFGMGVGSTCMTPEILTAFMDKEVSSRFPNGLTVTVSRGQWRSPRGGVIKEKTMVVDLQCPDTDAEREKVEAIAQAYLKQFGKLKGSVFIVRVPGISTQLWY